MAVTESVSSWQDHAWAHVSDVFDRRSGRVVSLDDIRAYVDDLIDTYFLGNMPLVDLEVWSELAVMVKDADVELDREFVWSTLCNKQRDYGPENILRFGHRGLIVRLHDKVARLENLLKSGKTPENESVADTYLDIVGYSVIGLMLLDRSFLKQMAD